jgi:hypothetical protein
MAVSAVATIIVIAAVPRTATPALDGTAPDGCGAARRADTAANPRYDRSTP